MKRALLFGLVLLLAFDASAKPGGMRGGVRGEGLLRAGRYRMAIEAYREEIARDPSAVAAHVGLGVALARIGRCEAAVNQLLPYEGTLPFTASVAMAAARCAARTGRAEDAVALGIEALRRQPRNVKALSALALDLDSLGDTVGRDELLERLLLVDKRKDASLFARAAIAVRAGDVEEFDIVSAQWEREGRASEELLRLRAVIWLDLDDPAQALAEMTAKAKVRRSREVRLAMLESRRRLGEAGSAIEEYSGALRTALTGLQAEMLHARLYIDVGDVGSARTLLEEYQEGDDEEVLATLWYLARATGNTEEQARLAAAWAAVNGSRLRTLDQLVPVNKR